MIAVHFLCDVYIIQMRKAKYYYDDSIVLNKDVIKLIAEILLLRYLCGFATVLISALNEITIDVLKISW